MFAESESLAEEVQVKANEFRREAALAWLGEELPPSVGPMMIYARISDVEEEGKTWRIDSPDRHYHTIWVTGSRELVLGALLRHEVTHAVLATQLPEGMPAFLDEGIASQADDPRRVAIRRKILDWFARTGNWPRLAAVMDMQMISANDQQSYAVAASVTEYLLTRGDKATLLKFARSGKANGWQVALRMHYQIGSVESLEQDWRAWEAERSSLAKTAARSDSFAR